MLLNLPLTRAAGMGPLPEVLEEAGGFGAVTRVFALAGLPIVLINERNHWVPLSFLADLFRFGSQVVDDPLFGLRVGQRMEPEQFGKWALYGLQAPTVVEMIRRLEEALQIHTRGVGFQLSPRRNGLVAWEYFHPNVSDKRFIHHGDHLVPVIVKALQRFMGQEFKPTLIEAPYTCQPSAADDRQQLTSLPWAFGRERLAVVLPNELLSTRNPFDRRANNYPNLEAEVAALIEQSRREVHDTATRVEVIMMLRMMDRKSDIEGLASLLGISTRRLQRDLTELGQGYRKMLTRVRMQRAQDLIETSRASLTEISHEINYSDSAHFTRAFKRHFGYPPSNVRRQPS